VCLSGEAAEVDGWSVPHPPYLGEALPLCEEVEQLGNNLLAAAGINVHVVENAGLLQYQTLFDAIKGGVLHCKFRGTRLGDTGVLAGASR
jgi:hypothetical protein